MPKSNLNKLPEPAKTDKREQKFIECLFQGKTKMEAGLEAGYSKSSLRSSIYTKFRSPDFKSKMVQYALAHNVAMLPKLINVDNGVVNVLDRAANEAMSEDKIEQQEGERKLVEYVPKLQHAIKSIKTAAGVLQPDSAAQAPVININQVKNMMVKLGSETVNSVSSKMPDSGNLHVIDIDRDNTNV